MKWAYLILILIFVSGCVQLADLKKPEDAPGPETFVIPSETSRIRHDGTEVFVDMTARQWEFLPNYIEVNRGDTVTIYAQSADILHSIAIPGLDIEQALEPNRPVTIRFVADREGEYNFKSTKYSGIGFLKMKGIIVVKP